MMIKLYSALFISVHVFARVSLLKIPYPEFYAFNAYLILHRHNMYRHCHGAPPLELDEQLCQEAQIEANMLAGHNMADLTTGTNLFSEFSNYSIDTIEISSLESDLTNASFLLSLPGINAVDFWYNEIQRYEEADSLNTASNFSQLVWRSSEKLGVGLSQDNNGRIFLLCKYEPVGNVDGLYGENVLAIENLTSSPNALDCLLTNLTQPQEYVELFQNVTRYPMYAQLVNSLNMSVQVEEGADDNKVVGEQSLMETDKFSEAAAPMNDTKIPSGTKKLANESRPILNALKKELAAAVNEQTSKYDRMMAVMAGCCILSAILDVLTLLFVITSYYKNHMDESFPSSCASGGDATPCDDPRCAKSLSSSPSVTQSLQSYM